MDIRDLMPATRRAVGNTYDLLHGAYEKLGSIHEDIGNLNERVDALAAQLHELHRRLEQADVGINSNINFKYHQMLEPLIMGVDAKTSMMLWELYRDDGEQLDDAKKRFFLRLPLATGPLRVFQLGCAQLLKEFDVLCTRASFPGMMISMSV